MIKSNKNILKKLPKVGLPKNTEGQNGDLSLNTVNGRMGLYGKINNKWYRFGSAQQENPKGHVNISDDRLKSDYSVKQLNADIITINDIKAVTSDTDKFLMSDSGTIKYVTGANLLSYIGGSSTTGTVTSVGTTGTVNGITLTGTVTTSGNLTLGGTLTINNGDWSGTALADGNIASASTWNAKQDALTFGISNTNAVKIDAADVADDEYARFTANGLESRTLGEIKTDIGTGNSALVPSAGTSGHFLKHDGTFGQVAYSNLSGTPTIPANYVTDDADDIMLGSLNLKKISDDATARSLIFEKNRATATTANDGDVVGQIEWKAYNDAGTPELGTFAAIKTTVVDASDASETGMIEFQVLGTSEYADDNTPVTALKLTGISGNYEHADVQIGTGQPTTITNLCSTSDFRYYLAESRARILLEPGNPFGGANPSITLTGADDDDLFKIETSGVGATTISTVDDGGAAAHLTIAPDGDTIFNTDGLVIQDNGDVSTPASGYGTLYVNSDVLYFKTDGGTATNLLAGGGGSGLNSIIAAMVFG